jgi:tetratricopeptide (TPR) repeat protein
MNARLVGLLVAAGSLLHGPAWAANPDSPKPADEWRGRRVLAASPHVFPRERPEEQAPAVTVSPAGIWLDVKRSEGDWLQVDLGWVRAADVVRDDQAIEYFTAELARSESAFAYIGRSRAWLEKNDLDKAQADVSEALRLEPRNARAYFAQSRIAAAQQRTEDERAACDRALEIDPRDPFALEVRGRLRAMAGEYDRALSDVDLAIESLPKSSRLRSARGYCWRMKGDLDKALADSTEAIQLDPLDAFSLTQRAAIYLQRQEFDKALRDAEEALRADPKLARAILIRGSVRAQKGDLNAALSDLDDSIRLDATDPAAFRNRGRIHFLKGQYDAALIDYTQAISLDADGVESYVRRAEIWWKKGDVASASIDITQYLRLRPRDANAYAQRGWLRKDTDLDAALADFDAALEINPRFVRALLERADVWRKKDEPAKALADLSAAIELDPKNADAYSQRAHLRSSQQEHRLAVDDLTAALRINPNDASRLLRRSFEWSRSGNLEQALEDCRAALAIEPKNLMAYYQMAMAHSAAGQRDAALEDFAAALRIDPHDEEIRFLRAYELFIQGKLDLALADVDQVIQHGKRVADAYHLRAYFRLLRKNWKQALADCNEAIRLGPKQADYWCRRANCWYGMKQFDKAIEDADEALRLDSKSIEAASVRRQALEAKDDPSKAEDLQTGGQEIGEDAIGVELTEGELAASYEIELRGPGGLKLTCETAAAEEFGPEAVPLPIHLPMLDDVRGRFKLTGIPGGANAALYARLEAKRLSPQQIATLRAADPSIALTQADLDAALSGKDVTKILVLRPHGGEPAAKPELEVLTSAEPDPKADPIAAASRRGALVATLFISKRLPPRFSSLPDDRLIVLCLRGPKGLTFTLESPAPGRDAGQPLPMPAYFALAAGSAMRFKLSGLPAAEKDPVYALLTLPPRAGLLATSELPITFSRDDLDAAISGKTVTCALYLARGGKEENAPRLQTLTSAQMESGKDPVADAAKHGTIVAVLLLSRNLADLSLPEVAPGRDFGSPSPAR